MNQPSAETRGDRPVVPGLRLDLVAGLTAAAVVLPKAMAYATVAGLPVAVGLYTAFIPMAIYALLGTSRVLSVSSTTTLAILAGTELGLVVPDGDPAKLVIATATLTALVGAILLIGAAAAARIRRELHLDAGADRLQGGNRPRDRAGPGAEACSASTSRSTASSRDVVSVAHHVPDTSLITLAVALATFAVLIGMERLWPHSPAPLGRRRRQHRRVVVLRPARRAGVSTVGLIPPGLPVAHPAGPLADRHSSCRARSGSR